jgi:tight adherence protein B
VDIASLKLIVAGSVFVSLALGWVGLTTSVRAAIQRYERHVSGEVEAGLHALFIDLSGQQLILIAVALGAVMTLGVALVLPWPIALAAGLPGLLAPRLALRWIKNRRHRAFIEQLPDALQGLASSMRAGSNLGRGLELLSQQQAAPLGEEFALKSDYFAALWWCLIRWAAISLGLWICSRQRYVSVHRLRSASWR